MQTPKRWAALVLTPMFLAACAAGDEGNAGSARPDVTPDAPPGASRSPAPETDPPQAPAGGTAAAEVSQAPGAAPAAPVLVAATPTRALGCTSVVVEGLGVAGGHAYWVVQCGKTYPRPDEHLVLGAPVDGGPVDVVAASAGRLSIATGTQVAIRTEGEHVGVLRGGEVAPFPTVLPDSADCDAIATAGDEVRCLAGTEATGRKLKTWSVVGADPTTIAGVGPKTFAVGATAGEVVVDDGEVLVAELGTFFPHEGKGTPTHRRDGRIVRLDPATGAPTVVADGLAPFALTARHGAIAWKDMFEPERSVVLPAAGALVDTTAVVATLAWGLRDVAVDAGASGTVLWIASREPTADVVLAPDVRARFVVDEREMPRYPTVDAAYVYWVTSQGVFRQAK